MFKAVHAITAAVPFRATAAPRLSVDGVVRRHADACPRPTLQAHWARVESADGVPSLALRWSISDGAAVFTPDAPSPVLSCVA